MHAIRAAILLSLSMVSCSAAAEVIWAELDSPYQRQIVREPVGLVEVRGWAGTGEREPSGVDVDGDGEVGRTVRIGNVGGVKGLEVVTDPDDTIAAAELVAARRLIERLDPSTTRMGLVTFARTERVLARIGTPAEEILAELDALPVRPGPGGTYFYGAIIAAIKVFEQAPAVDGETRHRSIILLSDGLPNRPPPPASAAKAAVRASQHAARARIRIFSFALGPEVAARPEVFLEMAKVNDGELLIVEDPSGIIDFVPHMSLSDLESVEIDNLSTSQSARAVRLFPDGTFDGYAPLVSGENLLRITIHGEAGGTRTIDRRVIFEKIAGDTPEAQQRMGQLLKELRIRTLETALAEEAKRKREYVIQRQLEITIED